MTKGKYIRTKEILNNYSRRMMGNTRGFKKGNTPWNKNIKMPKEFCEKCRDNHLGIKLSKSHIRNISRANKGKTHKEIYGKKSEALKANLSKKRKLLYKMGKIKLSSSCFENGSKHLF
jgi:hypothetical protein